MVFQNNVLAGGAGGSGTTVYAIDQSIRFNEADSPYMQKTYSGDGSRTTWSFSFWMKLGKSPPYNTSQANPFMAYNTTSGAQEDIRIIGTNQQLQWFTHNDGGTGTLSDLKTTQYLRDHSAWYHILCVADRTNAVASERQRMYINGQRVTDFATETYPSKDAEGHVGKSADVHYIGSRGGNSNTRLDGYMAEIHYLDGLAYDPSFFGEFNSSGIWIPKEYTGSYGTNGFKIDGRDSSDLGDDESGQGNDYTTSGLASHDQVLDTPTNNFAVMNPNNNSGSGTLSQGNLRYAGASTGNNVAGTIGMSSDKWYWELYLEDDNQVFPGVQDSGILANGYTEKAVGVETNDNGDIHEDDANSGYNSIEANTNGDIIGVAFDATNKKIWWSLNGVWYRANQSTTAVINISEVEAGNQGYDLSSRTPDFFMPFIGNYTHGTAIINFGQEGTFAGNVTAGGNSDGNGVGNFKYSVPSGYLALCTKNLGS